MSQWIILNSNNPKKLVARIPSSGFMARLFLLPKKQKFVPEVTLTLHDFDLTPHFQAELGIRYHLPQNKIKGFKIPRNNRWFLVASQVKILWNFTSVKANRFYLTCGTSSPILAVTPCTRLLDHGEVGIERIDSLRRVMPHITIPEVSCFCTSEPPTGTQLFFGQSPTQEKL